MRGSRVVRASFALTSREAQWPNSTRPRVSVANNRIRGRFGAAINDMPGRIAMQRVRQFLVGAALIAAVAGAPTTLWAAEAKIGAVFPMSGPNADYGDTFMSGANLAVTHVNADKM